MHFSRSVRFSVGLLYVVLAFTSEASVEVVNGSTNLVGYVSSGAGLGQVSPGISLTWVALTGEVVSYGTNGVQVGTWTVADGHEYVVTVSHTGATLLDRSAGQTRWFWYGFSFVFCLGLTGLGARWTGRAITEGVNE